MKNARMKNCVRFVSSALVISVLSLGVSPVPAAAWGAFPRASFFHPGGRIEFHSRGVGSCGSLSPQSFFKPVFSSEMSDASMIKALLAYKAFQDPEVLEREISLYSDVGPKVIKLFFAQSVELDLKGISWEEKEAGEQPVMIMVVPCDVDGRSYYAYLVRYYGFLTRVEVHSPEEYMEQCGRLIEIGPLRWPELTPEAFARLRDNLSLDAADSAVVDITDESVRLATAFLEKINAKKLRERLERMVTSGNLIATQGTALVAGGFCMDMTKDEYARAWSIVERMLRMAGANMRAYGGRFREAFAEFCGDTDSFTLGGFDPELVLTILNLESGRRKVTSESGLEFYPPVSRQMWDVTGIKIEDCGTTIENIREAYDKVRQSKMEAYNHRLFKNFLMAAAEARTTVEEAMELIGKGTPEVRITPNVIKSPIRSEKDTVRSVDFTDTRTRARVTVAVQPRGPIPVEVRTRALKMLEIINAAAVTNAAGLLETIGEAGPAVLQAMGSISVETPEARLTANIVKNTVRSVDFTDTRTLTSVTAEVQDDGRIPDQAETNALKTLAIIDAAISKSRDTALREVEEFIKETGESYCYYGMDASRDPWTRRYVASQYRHRPGKGYDDFHVDPSHIFSTVFFKALGKGDYEEGDDIFRKKGWVRKKLHRILRPKIPLQGLAAISVKAPNGIMFTVNIENNDIRSVSLTNTQTGNSLTRTSATRPHVDFLDMDDVLFSLDAETSKYFTSVTSFLCSSSAGTTGLRGGLKHLGTGFVSFETPLAVVRMDILKPSYKLKEVEFVNRQTGDSVNVSVADLTLGYFDLIYGNDASLKEISFPEKEADALNTLGIIDSAALTNVKSRKLSIDRMPGGKITVTHISETTLPTTITKEDGEILVNENFVKVMRKLEELGLDAPDLRKKLPAPPGMVVDPWPRNLYWGILERLAGHDIIGHFRLENGAVVFDPDVDFAQGVGGSLPFYWLVMAEGNLRDSVSSVENFMLHNPQLFRRGTFNRDGEEDYIEARGEVQSFDTFQWLLSINDMPPIFKMPRRSVPTPAALLSLLLLKGRPLNVSEISGELNLSRRFIHTGTDKNYWDEEPRTGVFRLKRRFSHALPGDTWDSSEWKDREDGVSRGEDGVFGVDDDSPRFPSYGPMWFRMHDKGKVTDTGMLTRCLSVMEDMGIVNRITEDERGAPLDSPKYEAVPMTAAQAQKVQKILDERERFPGKPDYREEKGKILSVTEPVWADAVVKDAVEGARAQAAKQADGKMVIAVETGWIPEAQRPFIQGFIQEMDKLNRRDNVIVVRTSADRLAGELRDMADNQGIPLKNMVVLAGRDTVESGAFRSIRAEHDTDTDKAFVIGVDAGKLTDDSFIRFMEMLNMALRMASGQRLLSNHPFIEVARRNARFFIFTPKAEPVDIECLKEIYDSQKHVLSQA